MIEKIKYIEEGGVTYEIRTYSSGSKFYWVGDNLHRLDGPAVELDNGTKFYYINGECFDTFEEYKEAVIQYRIKEILNLEIN